MKRPDLVSILEAAYAIHDSDEAWVAGLVDAARPAMEHGLGACGYLYDLSGPGMRTWAFVDREMPIPGEMLAATVATATDDYVEQSWKTLACACASEVPGYDDQPAVRLYFHPHGVADMFAVNAYDPTGGGVWLGAPLPRKRSVRGAERVLWARVAAHVAAAFRLRRRAASLEAVLTPGGKTVHAEGDATLGPAREALAQAAMTIEKARGEMRRSDPEAAVVSWRALVAARWSLVDHFESDGKRYLVARTNDPMARGPEVLSAREKQVLEYASLGRETKLIAYELGISASTVRVLLVRAARKLGARSRAETIARYRAWRDR